MCVAAGCLHDQSMAMPRRCIAVRRRGCENALTMRCRPSIRATEPAYGTTTPVPRRRGVVDVDDRVVQPADVGDERQSAVPHRLHLSQPARLETARHQERVGAGEQVVGQTLVVSTDEGHMLRVSSCRPRQRIGEALITVAEHDQGRPEPPQERGQAATPDRRLSDRRDASPWSAADHPRRRVRSRPAAWRGSRPWQRDLSTRTVAGRW